MPGSGVNRAEMGIDGPETGKQVMKAPLKLDQRADKVTDDMKKQMAKLDVQLD